jgi:CRP/FNR family transcriptional regulator
MGDEGVLKIYVPGEIAGLPPLFDKEPKKRYVANLIALTDGRVNCWADNRLHTLMHRQPELLYLLNQHYSATLKELIDQTASLSLKSVADRLLDFLKKFGADENWVQLPFKKKQLAAILNTSPETISRSLKALVSEGKLAIDRKKIRMLQ